MLVKTNYLTYILLVISLVITATIFNPALAKKNNSPTQTLARIGVIPLQTPNNFLNPKAKSLVEAIINDTHDQIRDSATGIVHKHSLFGVGVTNPEILCQNPAGLSEFDPNYLHCGIFSGELVALRPSNEKAQQQLIRHYYTKATILGDRYKNEICQDSNFTSLLYIRSSNLEDLLNNLNTKESKLTIKISISAFTRGSNHESTEYLDIDIFQVRNNWEYDHNLIKAEIEKIAFTAYDKVLKANTITYSPKGTATLDGF